MMKKFVKKTFSILLVLAMLFAIPLFSTADGDFADDTVLVLLTHAVSLEKDDFTVAYFPEVGLTDVINLDPEGLNQIRTQQELLEKLGLTKEELEDLSQNTKSWNELKDSLPEGLLKLFEDHAGELGDVAENERVWAVLREILPDELLDVGRGGLWLVDPDKYHASLSLKLKNPSKENVLAAIKVLEQRDDVLFAEPNHRIYIPPVNIYIPYTMGDLNGDGEIKAVDARLALRASAELITLTDEQKAAADVFYDGNFSAVNARKILRVSAKLDKVSWIASLKADAELRLRNDFLEFYNLKAHEPFDGGSADINMAHGGTFAKGFAVFIYEPVMISHEAFIPIDIGGFTFYNAHPACYFYDMENEKFILFSEENKDILLELISLDGLENLSLIHRAVYKVGPDYD